MSNINLGHNHRPSEKQMFIHNSNEINTHNLNMVFALLLIHTCLSILLSLFVFFTNCFQYRIRSYFICSVAAIIIYILFKLLKPFLKGVIMLYMGYTGLFLYCVYSSRFLSPDVTCTTILALLAQFPLTIIDKRWRINLVLFIFTIFYIILVIPYKDPSIALYECSNVIFFSIMSSLIGHQLRSSRLETLELRRIGLIRETTDTLTGLPNRRKLFEIIDNFNRYNPTFTHIAMMDIDFFKLYNDRYGHQAGDLCLYKISRCFIEISREYPVTFYRYGGEEFMAFIDYSDINEAKKLCQLINKKIYDLKIKHTNSSIGYVSVSIGLASLSDIPPSSSFDAWICAADSALYGAKSSGRNTTFVYPFT